MIPQTVRVDQIDKGVCLKKSRKHNVNRCYLGGTTKKTWAQLENSRPEDSKQDTRLRTPTLRKRFRCAKRRGKVETKQGVARTRKVNDCGGCKRKILDRHLTRKGRRGYLGEPVEDSGHGPERRHGRKQKQQHREAEAPREFRRKTGGVDRWCHKKASKINC